MNQTVTSSPLAIARRLSIAPMLDWTDRHCRYFHRLLSKNVLLYTEMVNVNAIIRGDAHRHLDFDASEHPLVLQLGGSEPDLLARCTKIAHQWGYDEVNLNCGCPSERVQSGSFGACLMHEPQLVADCLKAMRDAAPIEVSVKHRIGLDKHEDYGFVRDFVGAVAQSGVKVFIVHARNAWLKGLSPKENREIPPLRYDIVHRLKQDFPDLHISLNGGVQDFATIQEQLHHVDGVMVGRWFYHEPYALAQADQRIFGEPERPMIEREAVIEQLVRYAETQIKLGVPLRAMTRHWLNLYHGVPGARRWRHQLSDAKWLNQNDARLLLDNLPRAMPDTNEAV